MKEIILENIDGRKFKLVPNVTTNELGVEVVTIGTEEIASKCNIGYEVKFLVDPNLVLDSSSGEPNANFIALFPDLSLKSQTKMSYYDDDDLSLNKAGWTIRVRKKSNKKAQQCTFKKRYSKINKKQKLTQGDVNRSVKTATREGFDSLNANFRNGAEIDYGFSKCTLSYSFDIDIAETGKGNTDIPDSVTSIQFIKDNKPAIFTEDLSNIREHGAVTLTAYEGTMDDVAIGLEYMTIKDSLGTGTETLCEVSFKLEDYTGIRYEGETDLELVNKLREKLRTKLQDAGFLLEKDGLKTNAVLERY